MNVTVPFTMSGGSGHRAAEQEHCKILKLNYAHFNKNLLIILKITQHSRLHTGTVGANVAEFTSTCVHVTDAFPMSSNPGSQV